MPQTNVSMAKKLAKKLGVTVEASQNKCKKLDARTSTMVQMIVFQVILSTRTVYIVFSLAILSV